MVQELFLVRALGTKALREAGLGANGIPHETPTRLGDETPPIEGSGDDAGASPDDGISYF